MPFTAFSHSISKLTKKDNREEPILFSVFREFKNNEFQVQKHSQYARQGSVLEPGKGPLLVFSFLKGNSNLHPCEWFVIASAITLYNHFGSKFSLWDHFRSTYAAEEQIKSSEQARFDG